MGEREVEFGEVKGPSCLASSELMSLPEVGEVLVISEDIEGLGCAFEEVVPVL